MSGLCGVGAQPRRIVVAGAGIIGSSVALQLARRGAHVTVVEKAEPASGATANSFAWLNSTFEKQPRAYYELNRLGIFAWRQVNDELKGALDVRWTGSVEWYPDAAKAEELRRSVQHHQAWGYGTRTIDEAALRSLEPKVTVGRFAGGAYSDVEGHVDPVFAATLLLDRAREAGATVLTRTAITGLDRPGGTLRGVTTTSARLDADVLVVACGVDTPTVAAMAGLTIPMQHSPGVLAHTAPLPQLIDRVVLAPGAHMKQKSDGRIVTGEGFGGTPIQNTSKEEGHRALVAAKQFLPGLDAERLERVTLGYRPLPKDGLPVIGFSRQAPDVYLAVMHSGMTLSQFVARSAAVEILDGVSLDALEPFRYSRFAGGA